MMSDNSLSSVLYNLRREKGITQRDLANALNMSDKAISRWETGNATPNLEMLYKISKYFNVSYSDLITIRTNDEQIDNKNLINAILEEYKKNKRKNFEILKIIGIVISFFRLIVHIIELILFK